MSYNQVIFARLWNDPIYIALHAAKDAIRPYNMASGSPERDLALARFGKLCIAIEAYERKAGVE